MQPVFTNTLEAAKRWRQPSAPWASRRSKGPSAPPLLRADVGRRAERRRASLSGVHQHMCFLPPRADFQSAVELALLNQARCVGSPSLSAWNSFCSIFLKCVAVLLLCATSTIVLLIACCFHSHVPLCLLEANVTSVCPKQVNRAALIYSCGVIHI